MSLLLPNLLNPLLLNAGGQPPFFPHLAPRTWQPFGGGHPPPPVKGGGGEGYRGPQKAENTPSGPPLGVPPTEGGATGYWGGS
jgi:hypothetical protein